MAVLTTRVQRFFHLFFLSTTSEKSFIPYKASAAVQALKVCPVRPRVLSSLSSRPRVLFVQFGQESCLPGEYLHHSEQLWMLEKVSAALNTTPITIHKLHAYPKIHTKKKKKLGNNFAREAEGCR